jgi:hypothetical protein
MKITTVFFSVALLGMISCNQNKKPNEDTTHNNDRQKEEAVEKNKSTEAFNFEKIPLSTKEVGNFPYVVAPEGYRFANEKEKRIEEKYFFHNDSLVKKVNGQYFHATVYQNGDVFEDTFLVNMLKEQIEQLGGSRNIFRGFTLRSKRNDST